MYIGCIIDSSTLVGTLYSSSLFVFFVMFILLLVHQLISTASNSTTTTVIFFSSYSPLFNIFSKSHAETPMKKKRRRGNMPLLLKQQ